MSHNRDFPSFSSLFRDLHYARLLNGYPEDTRAVLRSCLAASPDPEKEILAMLAQEWRAQLVAAIAILEHGASDHTLAALWEALDHNSWVAPQICLVLAILDPEADRKMKKRLIEGCLKPHRKYQLVKSWSTLCWYLALSQEGREWLLARFSAEEVLSRVLDVSGRGAEGPNNANDYYKVLRDVRPDFNPGPPFEGMHPARTLAKLWATPERLAELQCPTNTVKALLAEEVDVHTLVEPLLRPGLDKGDTHFEFGEGGVCSKSAKVSVEPGLMEVILEYLPGYPHWSEVVGKLEAGETLPNLTISASGSIVHLQVPSSRKKLEGRISLSRDLLQNAGTDVICYGAKDTGEMGGGAAMAVYQACGAELLESAQEKLSETDRQVGDVIFTPAFRHPGADIVGHIISIKTRTSQGDWCPEPRRLGKGVYQALEGLHRLRVRGLESVAFSCLATGEGRAEPKLIASLMLGAARRFFKDVPESNMRVVFCLPNGRDFRAFEAAMASTI